MHTPTLGRIANERIGYNRFQTTAMCSPTPASLLTGRDHHRVGNVQIAEFADDWDGYSETIPCSRALQPGKPFYLYWASGVVDGPHSVWKQWADKFKGKFDDARDAYRERKLNYLQQKGWGPSTRRSGTGIRHSKCIRGMDAPRNHSAFKFLLPDCAV